MATAAYLKAIASNLASGLATEHTHRPALKAWLEARAKGIAATNEPRAIECGAPDFIVQQGAVPLGYVEAKDVGKSLDQEEKSEQLKRYREALPNLILTDYLEFRWYSNGERRLAARLAHVVDAKGKLKPVPDAASNVEALVQAFFDASTPTVKSPRDRTRSFGPSTNEAGASPTSSARTVTRRPASSPPRTSLRFRGRAKRRSRKSSGCLTSSTTQGSSERWLTRFA